MRRNRLIRGLVVAAGLTGLLTLVVSTVSAGGFLSPGRQETESIGKPTWAVPAARKPVEGEAEGTEAIEAELFNAELRITEAMQNAETAAYQYKRARTRNYPRGDALQALKVQAQETSGERSAAADEFSDIVERARRDGVPMGTLTHYLDLDERLDGERAGWNWK
jgi:hypothetical protein